jgi:excisionase family DNA binding protein
MNVGELAEVPQVSQRHIYTLVSENKIPHVRIGGAGRFDPTDIAEWVAKMAAEHAPDARIK